MADPLTEREREQALELAGVFRVALADAVRPFLARTEHMSDLAVMSAIAAECMCLAASMHRGCFGTPESFIDMARTAARADREGKSHDHERPTN